MVEAVDFAEDGIFVLITERNMREALFDTKEKALALLGG